MNDDLLMDVDEIVKEAARAGVFQGRCSIYRSAIQAGAPSGDYQPLEDFTDIPCQDAPEALGGTSATEIKALSETASLQMRAVLLDGNYPGILTADRAFIWHVRTGEENGIWYDIVGTGDDSTRTQTVLTVRRVDV